MLEGLKRRAPLLANLRLFQILFGGVLVWLTLPLMAGGLSREAVVLRLVGVALATLVFAIYLQNVHRFGLVPDYSMKCRYCNGPVNRYSEFCEHCGADLIAEELLIHCPKCDSEVYEGTKHCPECGARMPSPKRSTKKKKPKEPGWDTPIDATTGVPPPARDDESR